MQQLRVILPNTSCNLHCKYCLDGYDNSAFCHKDIPVAAAPDFSRLLATAGKFSIDHISIWGGEPLMNPVLEPLLRTLHAEYPNINISFLSNGTLLTDAWADKLNELKVILSISHDGPTTAQFRNIDVLTDTFRDRLARLYKFGNFDCTIHKYNCDIPAIIAFFQEKRPTEKTQLTFEQFELTNLGGLRFLPGPEECRKLYAGWKEAARMAMDGEPLLQLQLQHWRECNRKTQGTTACGANNRLVVDLNGRIFHCQVAHETNFSGRVNNAIPHMCETCEYALGCRGICGIMPDRFRRKLCLSRRVYYDAINEVIG